MMAHTVIRGAVRFGFVRRLLAHKLIRSTGRLIRGSSQVAAVIALAFTLGCVSIETESRPEQVSLSEATQLIESRQVATLYQPHSGPVGMQLRDGRRVCFDQPHIDWVLGFIDDNNLGDAIDEILVE